MELSELPAKDKRITILFSLILSSFARLSIAAISQTGLVFRSSGNCKSYLTRQIFLVEGAFET